jgi:hypothetical protein
VVKSVDLSKIKISVSKQLNLKVERRGQQVCGGFKKKKVEIIPGIEIFALRW